MGCCGGSADWKREEVLDHKFDFIDVREYRDTGFMTQFKYTMLFANMAKSVAVYLADIYTAITLLAIGHFTGTPYTEAQNGQDNPLSVSVEYSRWIFVGCIIFSFLLLAYEAHKSRAIVRSRDISYAYTNVMANNWYSLNSYDHFCFFQQINNSTKKQDEFAFFIFFTFKGWKRLLVADGPRQVINAFVLFSVAADHNFTSDVYQYYNGNILTGVMLITMIFTVVVFAASAFLLAVAALMYIPLIIHIKGNLKEYCCHKIDKRISELVRRKKKTRMARQVALARKEADGDFSHLRNKKGELVGRAIPQPTLPNVEVDLYSDSGSTLGNHTVGAGYPASIIGTDKGGHLDSASSKVPLQQQQQQKQGIQHYYHESGSGAGGYVLDQDQQTQQHYGDYDDGQYHQQYQHDAGQHQYQQQQQQYDEYDGQQQHYHADPYSQQQQQQPQQQQSYEYGYPSPDPHQQSHHYQQQHQYPEYQQQQQQHPYQHSHSGSLQYAPSNASRGPAGQGQGQHGPNQL